MNNSWFSSHLKKTSLEIYIYLVWLPTFPFFCRFSLRGLKVTFYVLISCKTCLPLLRQEVFEEKLCRLRDAHVARVCIHALKIEENRVVSALGFLVSLSLQQSQGQGETSKLSTQNL
jgi:hypothetical protein